MIIGYEALVLSSHPNPSTVNFNLAVEESPSRPIKSVFFI